MWVFEEKVVDNSWASLKAVIDRPRNKTSMATTFILLFCYIYSACSVEVQ